MVSSIFYVLSSRSVIRVFYMDWNLQLGIMQIATNTRISVMTYVLGAKGKMLPSVTRCFEIRRSRIRYSFFHIMFPTPPRDLGWMVSGISLYYRLHTIPNFGWLCNFHQLLLNSPMENGVKSKVVFVLEKLGPGGMLSYVIQNASSSMSL